MVFEQKQDAALSCYLTTPQKKQVSEAFYALTANGWEVNEETRRKLQAMGAWLTRK